MRNPFKTIFVLIAALYSLVYSNVLLTVADPAGVARVNEPVTSGVPIGLNEGVYSIDNLGLFKAGIEVPCQFTVTSRWKGTPEDNTKPVKWLLLDFTADVPANGSVDYELRFSGGSGNATGTQLNSTEDGQELRVNTGKISFVVNKSYFNFLSLVTRGSDTLVKAGPNLGGADVTLSNNDLFRSVFDTPDSVCVEQAGPLRMVIKVMGSFRKSALGELLNPDGGRGWVNYTMRIYAYNNQDYVRFFFSLENHGEGVWMWNVNPALNQPLVFDNMKLSLASVFNGTRTVGTSGYSGMVSGSESFVVRQDHHVNAEFDENANFLYRLLKGGVVQDSGLGRLSGWMDVNNGSKGICVAIRDFWRNWPNGMSLDSGVLNLDFFPHFDNEYTFWDSTDYFLRGGLQKTHEGVMRFFQGNADTVADAALCTGMLNAPLFAQAKDPRYYTDTRCWGTLGPSNLTYSDTDLTVALARYEQLQLTRIDSNASESEYGTGARVKNSIVYNREHRDMCGWASMDWYGWKNFGDIPWGDGYSGGHYDHAFSTLAHFLRTGNRGFLDLGTSMVKHRYDIDQCHDYNSKPPYWTKFLEVYEKDDHGQGLYTQIPVPTHTWSEGLWLYYVLTGDMKAREAGELVGQAMQNIYGEGGMTNMVSAGPQIDAAINDPGSIEIRNQGWSLLNSLNNYRITGRPEMLAVADGLFRNFFLALEQNRGGHGYFDSPTRQFMLHFSYITHPLLRLHYETGDTALGHMIERMARFARDSVLWGGFQTDSGYMPYNLRTYWSSGDTAQVPAGEVLYIFYTTDLMAYTYKLTGDTTYLNLARKLFRDGTFYYDSYPGLARTAKTPIRWNPSMFNTSASKGHGWMGRGMMTYLFVEDSLQRAVSAERVDRQVTGNPAMNLQPNPFNPSTAIHYQIAQKGRAALRIYGVNGMQIKKVDLGVCLPGNYSIAWNGRDAHGKQMASGVYFIQLTTAGKEIVKKGIMMK
ncbi:MAG: FlgD immunoglobulin-like domain containing protein [Fibrobacterota bacterium]